MDVSVASISCKGLMRDLLHIVIADMDDSPWLQPGAAEEVFPFRPWWMANQLTNRFFRRQRRSAGIVEECCVFKGCTVSELSEYCAAR